MFMIVRMGKYFYYWILQGAFFVAITILGVFMEEPEAYATAAVIGFPVFIVLSFIIMVFSYRRAWVIDGRRHWIYFAVFILIVSAIASPVIVHFATITSSAFGDFLIYWGLLGAIATLITMPIALLFRPRLMIKERPTSFGNS